MKKILIICTLIALCFSIESKSNVKAAGCPSNATEVTNNNVVYCCWDAGAWWVCMPKDQE